MFSVGLFLQLKHVEARKQKCSLLTASFIDLNLLVALSADSEQKRDFHYFLAYLKCFEGVSELKLLFYFIFLVFCNFPFTFWLCVTIQTSCDCSIVCWGERILGRPSGKFNRLVSSFIRGRKKER